MAEQGNTQGNPTTVDQNEAEDAVFGSGDFFGQMEKSVNGMVDDGQETQSETEVTHSESGSEQVTHVESPNGSNNVNWDNDGNPYKKRYTDSSRECATIIPHWEQWQVWLPLIISSGLGIILIIFTSCCYVCCADKENKSAYLTGHTTRV